MKGRSRLAVALGVLTSRIGRRFVALFAGCALLPLTAFAWVAVSHTAEQLRREQVTVLHNGAKTAGMGIAARLSQVAGDLALAQECALRLGPMDPTAVAVLERQIGQRCAGAWIQDGDEVREIVGRSLPMPRPSASVRKHLAAGRPAVVDVDSPPALIMLTALEPGRADSPVLAVHIRAEWFWDPAELRAADCEVAAFGPQWRLLFHGFPQTPDTRAFRVLGPNQSAGTVEWSPNGAPHLARYWRAFLSPQYGFDFCIVQSRPVASVLAGSDRFSWSIVLTAVGTLLLVLVASLVQMRRTLDPILSLHEATRRVAVGDFSTRVVVRNHDELGDLGAAFNDMASQVQDLLRRREQTERELVASRDAALAAVTAKAEFVSNVSHELRTPMTEILGATEILTQVGDGDDTTREEFSRIALRGAQRLARLVDDVLQLGTDEVWTMAPVDLGATVRQAVEALGSSDRERVRVEIAPQLPHVIGKADRLTQAWGRLLDNAIKFSPLGSPIEVIVRGTARDGIVEVRDQGVGIAKADWERVFEPFCQVGRDQLTDKAAGTGLGLTLAKNTVDRHGGRIEVDSELGKGSTFRVLLPAHAELPAARI